MVAAGWGGFRHQTGQQEDSKEGIAGKEQKDRLPPKPDRHVSAQDRRYGWGQGHGGCDVGEQSCRLRRPMYVAHHGTPKHRSRTAPQGLQQTHEADRLNAAGQSNADTAQQKQQHATEKYRFAAIFVRQRAVDQLGQGETDEEDAEGLLDLIHLRIECLH